MYTYPYFDFFRDTAFCCGTDIFTAFYSGLVVFTIIGFMAKESGSSVDELARVSGRFFYKPFAPLGIFHVFSSADFVFFKIDFNEKCFQECHQRVKQFVS